MEDVLIRMRAGRRRQDIAILNHKKFLAKPALCEGDGLIQRYRTYAEKYDS